MSSSGTLRSRKRARRKARRHASATSSAHLNDVAVPSATPCPPTTTVIDDADPPKTPAFASAYFDDTVYAPLPLVYLRSNDTPPLDFRISQRLLSEVSPELESLIENALLIRPAYRRLHGLDTRENTVVIPLDRHADAIECVLQLIRPIPGCIPTFTSEHQVHETIWIMKEWNVCDALVAKLVNLFARVAAERPLVSYALVTGERWHPCLVNVAARACLGYEPTEEELGALSNKNAPPGQYLEPICCNMLNVYKFTAVKHAVNGLFTRRCTLKFEWLTQRDIAKFVFFACPLVQLEDNQRSRIQIGDRTMIEVCASWYPFLDALLWKINYSDNPFVVGFIDGFLRHRLPEIMPGMPASCSACAPAIEADTRKFIELLKTQMSETVKMVRTHHEFDISFREQDIVHVITFFPLEG